MALKCYTKPKSTGGNYTTCNKNIKENKRSRHKPGPKKGSSEAKKVMAHARAAQPQHKYNLRRR